LLFVLIVGLTWLYLSSQYFIGSIPAPTCHLRDLAQIWTGSWNEFLQTHKTFANVLLSLHALLGDATVLFLLILSIWKGSVRPSLPLLVFLILRQFLQFSTSLPTASGMIWHDPGCPSLFCIYGIHNDLYFSAYVGIAMLGLLELRRLGKPILTGIGWAALSFQALVNLALQSHYTTDIYTSIVTAIAVYLLVGRAIPTIDRWIGQWRTILIGLILVGVGGFFASQSWIAQKPIPTCGIDDTLHQFSLRINAFFHVHTWVGNGALILMNTVLDALTVFLMGLTIWKREIRPFLTTTLFMVLRQSLQFLVALPVPPFAIWYYPGFPSLLQTYEVINDLYFSGHTGVSMIAMIELCRFRKSWLSLVAVACFLFEAIGVIILQMHYTMDVYTAIVTVYCVYVLSCKWAPHVNRFLAKNILRNK